MPSAHVWTTFGEPHVQPERSRARHRNRFPTELKHEEEIRHFAANCLGFQRGRVPSAGGAFGVGYRAEQQSPRPAPAHDPKHFPTRRPTGDVTLL